jgi:hypothetical protein
MFHIVFLSIAVGFLLVYLREVTIVSYNSKKKAESGGGLNGGSRPLRLQMQGRLWVLSMHRKRQSFFIFFVLRFVLL